jgi:hypothetical protein
MINFACQHELKVAEKTSVSVGCRADRPGLRDASVRSWADEAYYSS